MKRSIKITLVTALAALALGAGTAAADHDRGYRDGPPAPRYTRVAPRVGYVWVEGRYNWEYNQWVWMPGHYERARVDDQDRDCNDRDHRDHRDQGRRQHRRGGWR